MPAKAGRNFCFTLFGDKPPTFVPETMSYMVYQIEICPTSKREHAQGYFELHHAQKATLGTAAMMIGLPFIKKGAKGGKGKIEFKYPKSTREQARAYCMKDETRADGEPAEVGPWEFGQWVEGGAGRRTDLAGAIDCKSEMEVAERAPEVLIKYPNGIARLMSLRVKPRDYRAGAPKITIRWGSTGKGKTWDAYNGMDPEDVFSKDGTHWWDGYTGQRRILLDEFGRGWWPVDMALKIFDRYPVKGQIKGGYVNINSQEIYITSHSDPKTWFPTERWPEFERRFRANPESTIDCVDDPAPPPAVIKPPVAPPPGYLDDYITELENMCAVTRNKWAERDANVASQLTVPPVVAPD